MPTHYESLMSDAHDFARDNFAGENGRELVTLHWNRQRIEAWTDSEVDETSTGRRMRVFFNKADIEGRPQAHRAGKGGDLIKVACEGEPDFIYCVERVGWERGTPCAWIDLGDPNSEI